MYKVYPDIGFPRPPMSPVSSHNKSNIGGISRLAQQVNVWLGPVGPNERSITEPTTDGRQNLQPTLLRLDIRDIYETHHRGPSNGVDRVLDRCVHDSQSPMGHFGNGVNLL
jgi:hypothetical protein